MATSGLFEELAKNSILDLIPGLQELAMRKGQIRLCPANTQVAREGERIDHLVVPVNGGLRLTQSSGTTGYLSRHQSLGLRELLEGKSYAYSAQTESEVHLFRLSVADFLDCLGQHPTALNYLRLMTSTSAARALKTYLSERSVTRGQLFEVFSAFAPSTTTFLPGASLAPLEGSLVLVQSGRIRLTGKEENGPQFNTELGEGAWFGGEALMRPFAWSYEASALERTDVHHAPLDKLRPLFERLGLADGIYDEPWISRRLSGDKGEARFSGRLTSLPGKVLDEAACRRAGVFVNPRDLRLVRSDSESYLASLENVCFLLGLSRNLSGVESLLLLKRRITPLSLAEILEPLGVLCEGRKVDPGRLSRCPVPAVVKFGPRLAVLLRVDLPFKRLLLLDPARGIVSLGEAEFRKHWDGQALVTTRLDASASSPASGKWEAVLSGCLSRNWRILANVLALGLLGILLHLLVPLLSQFVLEQVLSLKDTPTLWGAISGMFIVMLLGIAVHGAKEFAQSEFALRFQRDLAIALYRHALAVPSRFYAQRKTGYVLTRIQAISVIQNFIAGESLDGVLHVLSLLLSVAVLSFYSGTIAGIAAVLTVLVIGVQLYFANRMYADYGAMFEADLRAQSQISEQVGAITLIKALGTEAEMRGRWEKSFLDRLRHSRKMSFRVSSLHGAMELMSSVVRIGALWMGAYLALEGRLSHGEFLAIGMYLSQMLDPLTNLAHTVSESARFRISLSKLDEIFSQESEEGSRSGKVTHSFPLRGKIRFEKVSFRYGDKSPWVLREVSMTIYPSQRIAIVGRSGCGKSTIANLIAGNLKPVSGRIFYDDFDSEFLSQHCLRSQIGFIMQGNELFSGSLLDNIAISDDSPSEQKAAECAQLSCSDAFIDKLPSGMSYYLSESGVGLSGGERQRISIARTLYREPRILIFDEATSALDAHTERELLGNLDRVMKGKTSVIIAHRLSTVRNSDRIIVMDDGAIVEEGTHDALLETGRLYADLFRRQVESVKT